MKKKDDKLSPKETTLTERMLYLITRKVSRMEAQQFKYYYVALIICQMWVVASFLVNDFPARIVMLINGGFWGVLFLYALLTDLKSSTKELREILGEDDDD